MKCFYTNARSIRNKFGELQVYITSEKLDVVVITESWINENLLADRIIDYGIDNYDIFAYQRKTKLGGGILVYIKKHLKPVAVISCKLCEDVESVWVDLFPDDRRNNKIRIGSFYRPPNQNKEIDLAMIDELERGIINSTIIIGDFNLPNLCKDVPKNNTWETSLFRDNFDELFLTQHVLLPTRQSEILDLILTNDEKLIEDVELGEAIGNSDHAIIRFKIKCKFKRTNDRMFCTPNFGKGNYDAIRMFLSRFEWIEMFKGKTVDEMWIIVKSTLAEAQDRFIPMRRMGAMKSPKPLWFNHEVQQNFAEKKNAFYIFKTTPSANNKSSYFAARKRFKRVIRKAKRAAEIRLAEECKGDLKKFFSFYKFNRNDPRIGTIEKNGEVYRDDVLKAKAFNEKFSSVFTDEHLTNIPKIKSNGNSHGKLDTITLNVDDVLKQLLSVKENKACGPDNIHARIIKEAAKELALPLQIIFELSLKVGVIPNDWKCANVVPIFKGGDKTRIGNYRPVSLTSIVCKVFEKIIKHHIVIHLEQEDLLLPSQHGFRTGRSCLTNLIEFLEFATDHLDKGNNISVIYLDFCKAFDKVPHRRLLVSLENHGLGGSILRWIETWLLGRRQRVVLNGQQAAWIEVKSGVPQGTVLAPLLFIIFINQIDCNLTSKLWKFADDIKLAKVIKSADDKAMLQADLNALSKWTEEWQMEFNINKCKVLNLGAKECYTYNLNGNILQVVHEEKDLGVLITDDLKFSHHCKEARKKALKMLGVIQRNVSYKSKDVMKRLYCAFIRPHLEYCRQACYSSFKKDERSLERIQRRATKMIIGLEKKSYKERLISLNMFSLHYRRIRGDLIELFKIYAGLDKLNFTNLFTINSNQTRGHSCKLVKKSARTALRQSFFTHRVIDLWNNLPSWVIASNSLNEFKHSIDLYFIERGTIFDTIDD